MLSSREVLSLSELPTPVLTAYLNTGAPGPSNGRTATETESWIRQAAQTLVGMLAPKDQETFQKQVERVGNFLHERHAHEGSVVIVAGPKTWKLVPLRFRVENQLHWGKPALLELLSLIDECKPCCIVAIDHAGARFFRYELDTMADLGEIKFSANSAEWKKKDHAHMARPRTMMPHGMQRDVFKKRMDAQYQRFCRRVAFKAESLYKTAGTASIFLAGPERLTQQVAAHFSKKVASNVATVSEDLARVPLPKLERQLASRFVKWTDEHAMTRVNALLGGEHATVIGVDETLARLQSGTISTVVLARGFDTLVRQCVQCGLVSRSADPLCSICGSERPHLMLSEILPQLLRKHRAAIDVIHGEAGQKLIAAGGMGGWLRQPR
jgi:hypothetical protein